MSFLNLKYTVFFGTVNNLVGSNSNGSIDFSWSSTSKFFKISVKKYFTIKFPYFCPRQILGPSPIVETSRK